MKIVKRLLYCILPDEISSFRVENVIFLFIYVKIMYGHFALFPRIDDILHISGITKYNVDIQFITMI